MSEFFQLRMKFIPFLFMIISLFIHLSIYLFVFLFY
jgi:hypothetical protein